MKTALFLLLTVLALAGTSPAVVPQKAPLSKYARLWSDSPFTSKPVIEGNLLNNPLEDYTLGGISPVGGGYRVTLLNKKKPDERIYVDPNMTDPKHDFKILGVTLKEGNPLGTVVKLSSGTVTGSVAFDEKYLTLASTAGPKVVQAPNRPGATYQPQPQPVPQPVPQTGQTTQRPQRPRVVPPTTQPGAQPQPANRGINRR